MVLSPPSRETVTFKKCDELIFFTSHFLLNGKFALDLSFLLPEKMSSPSPHTVSKRAAIQAMVMRQEEADRVTFQKGRVSQVKITPHAGGTAQISARPISPVHPANLQQRAFQSSAASRP